MFNEGDSSNNSPLHYACAYGYYEIVELLMKAQVDINSYNSWKYTPLGISYAKKHIRIAKMLMECEGIDVNCKDDQGRTILIQSC